MQIIGAVRHFLGKAGIPRKKGAGTGEPPILTTTPAIVNASFAATGIRIHSLPITLLKIKAAAISKND